jgi:iron complex transport system permease protein
VKKIYLLAATLPPLILLALSLGATQVDQVWATILSFDFTSTALDSQIIWQIRAPRVIAAVLIGAILGIAGSLSQAATNNPLADPALLGTTAGAAAGVVIGIATNLISLNSLAAVVAATIGAMLATLLTFSLARSALQLIIMGVTVSALLTALVGIAISLVERQDLRSITFWSLGSLALIVPSDLLALLVVVILIFLAAHTLAPQLDLLSLGDSAVRHIGRDPQRIRLLAFLALSVAVAASVSTVGTIAFLALAAPHIARFMVGPRQRHLIVASAVIGSLILLISDTAARSIAPPQELPIGVLIAIFAAPLLILALKKGQMQWRS